MILPFMAGMAMKERQRVAAIRRKSRMNMLRKAFMVIRDVNPSGIIRLTFTA